jgi:hypothetical protein
MSMMDDIEKYAAIWEKALENGAFKDDPQPKASRNSDAENSFFGSDFFGQNYSSEYDMDSPLNESDTQYWAKICRMAGGKYVDSLAEEVTPTKSEIKDNAEKMANVHNPTYSASLGKDGFDPDKVTQNWGVGGKEHFDLEDLKKRLEQFESKLNSLNAKGKSTKEAQDKIDGIKKQIDDLSDSLFGNRFSADG